MFQEWAMVSPGNLSVKRNLQGPIRWIHFQDASNRFATATFTADEIFIIAVELVSTGQAGKAGLKEHLES